MGCRRRFSLVHSASRLHSKGRMSSAAAALHCAVNHCRTRLLSLHWRCRYSKTVVDHAGRVASEMALRQRGCRCCHNRT